MSQAGQLSSTLSPTVATSYVTNSGTAIPAANILNVLGAGSISTSGAGNTITITAAATFTWSTVAGTTQAVAANNGYINGNAGLTTFTLPATASVGDNFRIAGYGAGGWVLAQNAGQKVYLSSSTTTVGVGGSLASTNAHDSINVICMVVNTEWQVIDVVGNITVV